MAWFIRSEKKQKSKEYLWVQCPKCKKLVFKEDWHNNHSVCPKCDYHDKLNAYARIGITLDSDSFKEFNESIYPSDPLGFVDSKGSYKEKVKEVREKTKLNEAVVTGNGLMAGKPVVVAVMDFRFLGGSLGSATGEKILAGANYCYEHKTPFIIFSSSGGARMQEGVLSLMQMAKTCAGIARLNERKIPYISVLTDPTTGGVSASFAMVGDIHISEPGATIGFAGRRVIEQTIKQKLPDNFQTAEYMMERGFIDIISHRKDMRSTLINILSYYNR